VFWAYSVQGIERLVTAVPDRRLLTHHNHWPSTTLIVQCCYMRLPKTRTSLGDRFFIVTGPRLWNNLFLHFRDSELRFLEFHWLLKTHLFG